MNETQIIDGIPKIIRNAESLYSDAELLRNNGRKERAYTLYQLSIEEIGKAFMFVGALMFDDLTDKNIQRELKRNFKDHKQKSNISIGLNSFLWEFMKSKEPDKYEEILIKSFEEHSNVNEINEKKNLSLYVSYEGNKFISPEKKITQKDLDEIKSRAGYRVYIGSKIFRVVIENIDNIRKSIIESGFDSSKTSKEQKEEFDRVIKKFNFKFK